MPTKVKLSEIRSLTLYAGEKTEARRSTSIPQLQCVGKPCKKYQPDVVRCTNTGGSGVEVDWKCEADLPSSLRLGRVEVSCEGWSRPGDPNVLKGSCGLEYHLLEVPKVYRDSDGSQAASKRPLTDILNKTVDHLFFIIFVAVAMFMAYRMLKACLSAPLRPQAAGQQQGWGGGAGGWFGGGRGRRDPPPPYTSSDSQSSSTAQGWRPGFWTGLGVGGAAGRFFQPAQNDPYRAERMMRPSTWDWERFRSAPTPAAAAAPPVASPRANSWFAANEDRGEGSSTGTTRRSTGYGGSRVR